MTPLVLALIVVGPGLTREGGGVSDRRVSYLSTADFARLNYACVIVTDALGDIPYLVGSSVTKSEFRDVDIRSILADDEFDARFPSEPQWALFCWGVSELLSRMTGLTVDYQAQRMSEANAKYDGPRNPIGTRGRSFAGGGDATPYKARRELREGK